MKKILSSLVVLASVLLANPLVDLYRTQGISAVENEINKTLQDVNYWKQALQKDDLRFGYLSSFDYVLISQKSKPNIKAFTKKNGKFEKVFDSSVLVGEVSGDKQFEGDLRTPVGAYDITRRSTDVDPFYGPLALVTSYPNLYDVTQGKNGFGIWIHGVPEGAHRETVTQGCIAMENDLLLQLDSLIDHKKTVLLTNEYEYQDATLEDIASVFASIYAWQHSWKVNDIDTYMSFYDKDFLRLKKGGIKEDYNFFKRYKNIIFNRGERKQIVFSNINIIPYPNTNNKKLFKIEMHQDYWAPSFQSSGTKTLYIELKNEKMSILTER